VVHEYAYFLLIHLEIGLFAHNKLAFSQFTIWSSRGLDDSPTGQYMEME